MLTILGPTASGKTRLAVEIARRVGAEIVSADSRQVYRGLDIGTGKDLEEYGEVPYHLIDICDVREETYNVYRFCEDFRRVCAEIRSRDREVILCGGTGLYIEALLRGYRFGGVRSEELRVKSEELRGGVGAPTGRFVHSQGFQPLVEVISPYNRTLKECSANDHTAPLQGADSHMDSIPGVETPGCNNSPFQGSGCNNSPFQGSGCNNSPFQGSVGNNLLTSKLTTQNSPDNLITSKLTTQNSVLGILLDREERRERISRRLRARVEGGLVEEVERLLGDGVPAERLLALGLEYRFVTLYINGMLGREEALGRLEIAIHQFAKRQMTYFRGMERRMSAGAAPWGIRWLRPHELEREGYAFAEKVLGKG